MDATIAIESLVHFAVISHHGVYSSIWDLAVILIGYDLLRR
jgi:hypothetical protein